jgi:hypothetical protein
MSKRAAVRDCGIGETTVASGHLEGLSAIDFRAVTEGVSDAAFMERAHR